MNYVFTLLLLFAFTGILHSEGSDIMNPVLETIFSRKSVRHFKPGTVSKGQMEMLVRAGMAAPTAVDQRPWDFIIITDKDVLKKLAEALPYAKMAVDAQAGIIVVGDTEKQFGGKDSLFWIMDCSAAAENILLAAESMGLGAVWTALFPDQERVAVIRKMFNLPDNRIPLNFIPVGIPTGEDKPKDKYNKTQIHWNKW